MGWWDTQKKLITIQKYIHYKRERDEWENRYDPRHAKDEKKQSSSITKAEDMMRESIHKLMNLGIPADEITNVGGLDIKITLTDKEVWEMLEVQWN